MLDYRQEFNRRFRIPTEVFETDISSDFHLILTRINVFKPEEFKPSERSYHNRRIICSGLVVCKREKPTLTCHTRSAHHRYSEIHYLRGRRQHWFYRLAYLGTVQAERRGGEHPHPRKQSPLRWNRSCLRDQPRGGRKTWFAEDSSEVSHKLKYSKRGSRNLWHQKKLSYLSMWDTGFGIPDVCYHTYSGLRAVAWKRNVSFLNGMSKAPRRSEGRMMVQPEILNTSYFGGHVKAASKVYNGLMKRRFRQWWALA